LNIPAGPVLNVLLLSWLYAYYCYDYKWALQGARLPQRLAFFEAHWAFFAGGWVVGGCDWCFSLAISWSCPPQVCCSQLCSSVDSAPCMCSAVLLLVVLAAGCGYQVV
jgi:hypothetical protein